LDKSLIWETCETKDVELPEDDFLQVLGFEGFYYSYWAWAQYFSRKGNVWIPGPSKIKICKSDQQFSKDSDKHYEKGSMIVAVNYKDEGWKSLFDMKMNGKICDSKGTCKDNKWSGLWYEGFLGNPCSENFSNPCQNGGVCSPSASFTSYTCKCGSGWKGSTRTAYTTILAWIGEILGTRISKKSFIP
jgi:hypothetical protein